MMKKTGIVADSHSSITQKQAAELGIRVLPMPFYIQEECFYEDKTLTRGEFFSRLEEGIKISTSQASLEELMNIWDEALKEAEEILYFPLSSGLSGSCSTASVLAQEDTYAGKVFVVDNGRISTPQHCAILDALHLIEQGCSAAEVKEILEKEKDQMSIYIAVDTLKYLKAGGRITPAAAALGTVLKIKPVLQLHIGLLEEFRKCRGLQKAKKTMIEAIQNDLETKFKESYEKGNIHLMAASSASEEETAKWVEEIQEAFPGMEVLCDSLSLGVCCHTGPGALGIGCSCIPEYKK